MLGCEVGRSQKLSILQLFRLKRRYWNELPKSISKWHFCQTGKDIIIWNNCKCPNGVKNGGLAILGVGYVAFSVKLGKSYLVFVSFGKQVRFETSLDIKSDVGYRGRCAADFPVNAAATMTKC